MILDDGNTAADQLSIVRHQTCVVQYCLLIQSAPRDRTAPYTALHTDHRPTAVSSELTTQSCSQYRTGNGTAFRFVHHSVSL